MGQDLFDLVVVLTLVLFTVRGFINGFVGEVAGLVSLLGGFWAAHNYHTRLVPHLTLVSRSGAPSWPMCSFFWRLLCWWPCWRACYKKS